MASFWQKLKKRKVTNQRKALVKSRPHFHLPRQYDISEDSDLIQNLFDRVQRKILGEGLKRENILGRSAKVRAETGKLDEDRPYFFVQPWSDRGVLFERSHQGWLVSRADKIMATETFIRDGATLDAVTVLVPEDGKGLPRISSKMFDSHLLSFPVYEQDIVERIASLWGRG